MSGGLISSSTFIGIELFAFFGGILWFGWTQAKRMERLLAEDKAKAADEAASASASEALSDDRAGPAPRAG